MTKRTMTQPQPTCQACGKTATGYLSVYFSRYAADARHDHGISVGQPLCDACVKGVVVVRIHLPSDRVGDVQ